MTTPASDLADGNLRVTWVPAIANTAAPTATELNAAGSVDLSYYLTADGYAPGSDESVITDARLADVQTYEKLGRHTDSLTLRYIFRQQAAANAADNKAFSTLKHLTTGFIVTRWGKAATAAYAAADVVDVIPAQCGKQMKQSPEANSVLKVEQRIFITGPMKRDVTVA